MSEGFALDPRLAADTFVVGETPLSQVLLMNDARYPWLILVPWRCHISEPFELSEADQAQLWSHGHEVPDQTLLARHDAAVAAISPHICQTFVAMLAYTVARLLAAGIAFF